MQERQNKLSVHIHTSGGTVYIGCCKEVVVDRISIELNDNSILSVGETITLALSGDPLCYRARVVCCDGKQYTLTLLNPEW